MSTSKEDRIIKYFLGELSPSEEKELIFLVEEGEDREWSDLYNVYSKIWKSVKEVPIIERDYPASQRFEQWLSEQKEMQPRTVPSRYWRPGYMKYAAGIALALGCVFFLTYKSVKKSPKEVVSHKEEKLWQLVAAESTAEKIAGINRSLEIKKEDPEIIETLIKLVLNDDSPNVRLVAVEALCQYEMNNQIKEGLHNALRNEKQPVVQISLIKALVGMSDDRSRAQLEDLVDNRDIQKFVRDEAVLGLTRM